MFVLNNKLKWNEKMNAAIGFNIYFVFAWKFHGYFDSDELNFERWFVYSTKSFNFFKLVITFGLLTKFFNREFLGTISRSGEKE